MTQSEQSGSSDSTCPCSLPPPHYYISADLAPLLLMLYNGSGLENPISLMVRTPIKPGLKLMQLITGLNQHSTTAHDKLTAPSIQSQVKLRLSDDRFQNVLLYLSDYKVKVYFNNPQEEIH